MDMKEIVATFYNEKTASAPNAEEQEKVALAAQSELFLKIAADEGIDVPALLKEGKKEVVDQLWGNFQDNLKKYAAAERELAEKKAGGPPPFPPKKDDKDEDDKMRVMKEKADKEHEEKKASLNKIAMADHQGRVMAHALVHELGLITSGSPEINKVAAAAVTEIAKTASALATGKTASEMPFPPKKDDKGKDGKKDKDCDKEASAIDQLAVPAALHKVASWVFSLAKDKGLSQEECEKAASEAAHVAAEKIAAADTLGLYDKESAKVASANNTDQAIDWRACELLETVGYPINWTT